MEMLVRKSTTDDGSDHDGCEGLDGSWGSGSCSRTNSKGESWWHVDLGEVKDIRAVQVINAKDFTCGGQVVANEDCANDNLVLDWTGGSYTARERSD
jgi:hypothetical protein